jgi:signal transduction histidine kinase
MPLSIKQKQVLGVTSIVVLVVLVLSALHLVTLTRALLDQSRQRGEVLAMAIGHTAQDVVTTYESAYHDLRRDPGLRAALEAALYSEDVAYAAIVDRAGIVVAHSDPSRVGAALPSGDDLARLTAAGGVTQLRAVYQTERMLEWRQPVLLGDAPFAELRVGMSTLLIRRSLTDALRPAAAAAAVALLVAAGVAVSLAQIVVRPIHVIRSGLTRLGRGDLGATLDLKGDEFKELGDVFASVTSQLRTAVPEDDKRARLLELSRRVAALGRLTAGVAHEVKNPLNAMTIHLELMKAKLAAAAPAGSIEPHVDVIAREIRRLDDVVQGFLKFARPEELTLQPVAPAALADEVLKAVALEAQAAGVALEAVVAPNVPPIEADHAMLRQALLNLARNAIQAMPKGGRLRIACAVARDGRVDIRVADTGVGIPPENLARIFDLYFTTRDAGTGIGLSLVYRTVQLHGGDIDVESTESVGTTFILKMPRADRHRSPDQE